MKWINHLLDSLVPTFGGILTFCDDPDDLLNQPEVREEIRKQGMTIIDWESSSNILSDFAEISENEKPLIIVPDNSFRYLIENRFQDYRWENISVGGVFRKFSNEVVKSIPTRFWDAVFQTHEKTRGIQNATETSLQIGRAIYGIDPLYLIYGHGWVRLLAEISLSEEGLPFPIAEVIYKQYSNFSPFKVSIDTLTDTVEAQKVMGDILSSPSNLLKSTTNSALINVLMDHFKYQENKVKSRSFENLTTFHEALLPTNNITECLEFSKKYLLALSSGTLSEEEHLKANKNFVEWFKVNYNMVLQSPNPNVLTVNTIVRTLDNELMDDAFIFIVIDGLGIPAWFTMESAWIRSGLISKADIRYAFATIPTLTSLSRRAIFEGKLPAHFSSRRHSEHLERILWQQHFPNEGAYFSIKEPWGISDAIALAKKRIAVVDVSWDQQCHSIKPQFETLEEKAIAWAHRTSIREIISNAFNSGYRVFITSDHGQVLCKGVGRQKSGEITDERSKRVLIYNNSALQMQYGQSEHTFVFQPPGLQSNVYPVFSKNFTSFDQNEREGYSHGGISIEEVFVPVVEVFKP